MRSEDLINREFRVPFGFGSPHMQSVRRRIVPRHFALDDVSESRFVLVDMHDGSGDRLVASVHRSYAARMGEPADQTRTDAGPVLVVLIHGLGGSAESEYIRATARGLLRCGFNVARVDLRGAGHSGNHSRGLYHAGRTDDIRDLLRQLVVLPEAQSPQGEPRVAVAGFSLGGNAVLKLLGEPLQGLPVVSGVAVSAPLDLAVGSEHLHHMMFGLYERFVMNGLREDVARPGPESGLSDDEREVISTAKTVVEFDDAITAPRNGWRDAAEYYAVNSSGQYLPRIRVPVLVVHSLDDPMIPAGPYRSVDWDDVESHGFVRRAFTAHGGHVGFHQRGRVYPWYVAQMIRFFNTPDVG